MRSKYGFHDPWLPEPSAVDSDAASLFGLGVNLPSHFHIRLRGYHTRSLVRSSDGGLERALLLGKWKKPEFHAGNAPIWTVLLLAAGAYRSGSGISPKPVKGNAECCSKLRDGAEAIIVSDVAEFLLTSVSKVTSSYLTFTTPISNSNNR